jgi:hypothetical protein
MTQQVQAELQGCSRMGTTGVGTHTQELEIGGVRHGGTLGGI